MGSRKADVLAILAVHARTGRPEGPLALSARYLRAMERWEALPENADGADKGWVTRSREDLEAHFARARAT